MEQPKTITLPNTSVKLGIGTHNMRVLLIVNRLGLFRQKSRLGCRMLRIRLHRKSRRHRILFESSIEQRSYRTFRRFSRWREYSKLPTELIITESGDDEQITLNLPAISPEVSILIFPITVQTPQQNFSQVETAYFRAFSDPGSKKIIEISLKFPRP
jgi:hypothetical protein